MSFAVAQSNFLQSNSKNFAKQKSCLSGQLFLQSKKSLMFFVTFIFPVNLFVSAFYRMFYSVFFQIFSIGCPVFFISFYIFSFSFCFSFIAMFHLIMSYSLIVANISCVFSHIFHPLRFVCLRSSGCRLGKSTHR